MTGDSVSALRALDYSVVQQCMHCGMCLPTCPTYALTKRERHSPRGRIALMRAIADDELKVDADFAQEMDYCLGCLACQTACPAGVDYATLFETSRAAVEEARSRPGWAHRLYRALTLGLLFRRPIALRAFGRMTRWAQRMGLMDMITHGRLRMLAPPSWRRLLGMTPTISAKFSDERIAEVETPRDRRFRVGLLTGCVQDIAYADYNRDTADVLLANDCEVVTPRRQHCCGSIHGHNGAVEWAREVARKNLAAFDLDSLDAIITNAGGCGSHLRHYGHLLHDDPRWVDKARAWDAKVRDIHEWLVEIGFRAPTSAPWRALTVTYHESCHLTHGQKVIGAPRAILRSLPKTTMVELAESNWCCGSAGVYSITQPEASDALLERKIKHIVASGADAVATSNPGCDLQLQRGLGMAGRAVEVTSPVGLLAKAYRASLPEE